VRLRVSKAAQGELENILATTASRWAEEGRRRYRALLDAAVQAIVESPEGPSTRDRSDLRPGFRSFRIRHLGRAHGVRSPVHVVYFRVGRDVLEILGVLHERVDAGARLAAPARRRARPRRR
jgi:toxin ParE1/3/4